MNPTIPHELPPMPAGIETRLAELQARHKAHQHMLESHRQAKHDRRERHKQGWHRMKFTAQVLP